MNKYNGIRFYSRFQLAIRIAAIVAMEFIMLALVALC